MNLNPDFRDFIDCLNKAEVLHMVVGGYAVGIHGYPRYTGDLDIWIKREEENVNKLLKAIKMFGGPLHSIDKKKLLIEPSKDNPAPGITFGMDPVRIEVITQISGVSFDDCYARVQEMDSNGLKLFYIHYDDLKRNKLSTGRMQDKVDIEKIEKQINKNKK